MTPAYISHDTKRIVEIEISLARGAYADEVIPQLYAYTDCEVSLSSNIVVIEDRHPVELSVTELLGRPFEVRGTICSSPALVRSV